MTCAAIITVLSVPSTVQSPLRASSFKPQNNSTKWHYPHITDGDQPGRGTCPRAHRGSEGLLRPDARLHISWVPTGYFLALWPPRAWNQDRSWAQSTTDFTTRSNLWHLLPLIIKASMRCFHGVGASCGVKQEESIQQMLYPAGDGCTPSITVPLNQIPSRGV